MKTISRYIMTLALLLTAVGGAWAQDNRFFLEVSGTSATLKWGEPISNDNPSLYPGSSWKYQGNDWTDKSGITTITVDASCTNCSEVNISALFYKFVDLQTINNIENIKTDAVKYLGSMFHDCTSLQTPDLSSWNTENVTSMNGMFRGCTSLQTLDLSSFNTGKVNGMSYMFKDCSTLTTIYVGDGWSTDQLTRSSSSTEMFDGCVSLPNWDNASPVIDKTNAHTNAGGYLTYKAPAAPEPDVEVTWNAATKTGTFTMPAYDVEIDPIYAPAAQWAKDKEVDQLPTAIEGIFAGTTDAIVKAGTVAMMGKTENPQGIVMYAVTSINQATAPELSAFSADVPTAENIADEGADVLVWYYIQGANTPDGQEATAENTFNDSEICTTPIKVTVLPNKYDIQFNAANDNTIEAGKATVTVGGTAATVTEGKLQGVKMGSEVKLKAKPGYKFRKVEVKKGGAATLATALENGATVVIAFKYRDDGTCTFTNNNGTFTFVSGTGQLGAGNGPKQLSVENGKLIFKGSGTNSFTDRWSWYGFQVTFDPTANTYEVWKGSDLDVASFTSISVNGTDITDQLSELK